MQVLAQSASEELSAVRLSCRPRAHANFAEANERVDVREVKSRAKSVDRRLRSGTPKTKLSIARRNASHDSVTRDRRLKPVSLEDTHLYFPS